MSLVLSLLGRYTEGMIWSFLVYGGMGLGLGLGLDLGLENGLGILSFCSIGLHNAELGSWID